jgi:PTH1 family peptidyl-tRNA hydrolase
MKAIVGLGNPGPRYAGTRHNIGFAVVDELAARWRLSGFEPVLNARAARRWAADADPVWLVKPTTFMNESGEAVGEFVRYFKIDPADLLVIVDDVQLPLAKLRARARGSAGGHNGLKSIVGHLGSDFCRLRIGVGRGDARRDLADHVLARFEREEEADVEAMTSRAADAAEMFVRSGIATVMNAYNGGDPATTE